MVEVTSQGRPAVPASTGSFVEWGAIIAGGVMASALSFVLLTFGGAIGLSTTSPWSGASGSTVAYLAVFWALAQQIGAFLVGGYIAGRMRSRWAESNADEVEFRDGLHGGLVWAIGIVVGAALILSTAGSAVRTGAEAVGRVASAAASNIDPSAYFVDGMLRPAPAGATAPGGPAPAPTAPAGQQSANTGELRAEIGRILARSIANGSLADADRTYLANVVGRQTGLPPQEAERRVTEAYAQASRAAKEAADKARRTAVLGGFVTAAGLMISLAAAWWAAVKGGNHRDTSHPARFAFAQRRQF